MEVSVSGDEPGASLQKMLGLFFLHSNQSRLQDQDLPLPVDMLRPLLGKFNKAPAATAATAAIGDPTPNRVI